MPPAEGNTGRPPTWTRKRIIEAIHAWAREHGQPPKRHDWGTGGPTRLPHPTANAVYRRFGSWGAALEAAGYPPPPTGPPRREGGWDQQAIIDAILDWTERFRRPPTLTDWNPSLARRMGYPEAAELFDRERPRYPIASNAVKRFGCWNAALQAAEQSTTQAGLRRASSRARNAPPGAHTPAWTTEAVIAAIQAHATEHGRPPTYDSWAESDPAGQRPAASTVFQMFGSWRAAIIAAGHTPRGYQRQR